MIVPWLTFITVGLITYAGFLKLAARLLRYSVSWKASFLFAAIMLLLVILEHVLVFGEPVAMRIGHGVVLLLVLIILGGWFFSGRGINRRGAVLGWSGGIRLIELAFAMMITVGVRDRYSGSGFSQQSPFPAVLIGSDLHTNYD